MFQYYEIYLGIIPDYLYTINASWLDTIETATKNLEGGPNYVAVHTMIIATI